MRIVYSLIVLAFLLSLTACEDNMVTEQEEFISAEFEIKGELKTFRKLKFKNNSTLANRFLWDFGDGTHSPLPEPEKIFTQNGFYEITLDVRDTLSGSRDIKIQSVLIEFGRVYLKSISVSELPELNSSGEDWDSGSKPDVYFELFMGNIKAIDGFNYRITNANPVKKQINWKFGSPYLIPDWDRPSIIKLFDWDEGEYEEMGQTNAIVFSEYATEVAPDTINVKSSDGTIKASYIVKWE